MALYTDQTVDYFGSPLHADILHLVSHPPCTGNRCHSHPRQDGSIILKAADKMQWIVTGVEQV